MPAELHLNDGAAWRRAKELHIHDGAAWRKAKELWVHDGAAWRRVFVGGTVQLTGDSIFDSGAFSAEAGVSFTSDGQLFQTGANFGATPISGQWFSSPGAGTGAGFEIRATQLAGAGVEGASLGVWLSLSSSRAWFVSRNTGTGTTAATVRIEIRPVSGSIVASADFSFYASIGNDV